MSPADEAAQTFKTLCSTCHGADGKGDGVAAANLNPKPRNYTDKAWQASVTDEQLAKVILEGGAAVGKSPLMPPNPQLKDKPEVIAELVKIVRSFGQ
jgi:mono/diheme cytochrome c family protein